MLDNLIIGLSNDTNEKEPDKRKTADMINTRQMLAALWGKPEAVQNLQGYS